MQPEIKEQTKDNSQNQLNICITIEQAKQYYEQFIKKYLAKVKLPGFRAGQVPRSVVEQKDSERIQAQFFQDLLEEALKKAIDQAEKKPLHYASVHIDGQLSPFSWDKAYQYQVVYDIFPQVSIEQFDQIPVDQWAISITKEDIEQQIEQFQKKMASVEEKESGAQVDQGDLVTLDLVELAEDQKPITSTQKQDFVVDTQGDDPYQLSEDLIGMHQGDSKIISKKYPQDYAVEALKGREVDFQVKINFIRYKKLPEINDELAQDYSDQFSTLEQWRENIQQQLEKQAQQECRGSSIEQFLDQLVKKNPIVLPQSMIDYELEKQWDQLARQYQMKPEQLEQQLQGQVTKQSILENWKESVVQRTKKGLVLMQLIEHYQLKVDPEEIENYLKTNLGAQATPEQIQQYLDNAQLKKMVEQQVQEQKTLDFILENNPKGKEHKQNYTEFVKQQRSENA